MPEAANEIQVPSKSKQMPLVPYKAGAHLLYDLAGGRQKTSWRELGVKFCIDNIDDVYRRNRPWPSNFGRKDYLKACEDYVLEVHTSPHAVIETVRHSLMKSEVYVGELKDRIEAILRDSNDLAADKALARVLETITELMYSKVKPTACGSDRGGAVPAGDDRDGAPVVEDPQPALAPAVADRLTLRALASFLAGCPLPDGRPWYATLPGEGGAPVVEWGRVAPHVPVDALRFLGAFLPSQLFDQLVDDDACDALMDACAPQALVFDLADALCGEEGLACRALARRAREFAALADARALFAGVNYALGRLDAAGAPGVASARSQLLRHADGDAGRLLFCLVVWGLLGPRELRRVLECPATRTLFDRC